MKNKEDIIWHKSSRCNSDSGMCVEVARLPEVVGVRDTKNPQNTLGFSVKAFSGFLRTL